MIKMSRILAVVLIVIVSFGLIGCSAKPAIIEDENIDKGQTLKVGEDAKLEYEMETIYLKKLPVPGIGYEIIVSDGQAENFIAYTTKDIVLYKGEIYYFEFQSSGTEIFSVYSLDDKTGRSISVADSIMGTPAITALNDAVYISYPNVDKSIEKGVDMFDIIEYDITERTLTKYSELGAGSIDKNFARVEGGFVQIQRKDLIKLDESGQSTVVYTIDEEALRKEFGAKEVGVQKRVDLVNSHTVRLYITGLSSSGQWNDIGEIYLDVDSDYRLIKTEKK